MTFRSPDLSLTRRAFMAGVAAAAAGPVLRPRAQTLAAVSVDAGVLRERIEALSAFGRPAGGTFADGVSRVAYSDADVAGRDYVMRLMRAAGLAPRIDPAGNIFATRSGRDAALPAVLF